MSNVIRIYKDGEIQQIEKASLNRFLEEGWTTSNDGSNAPKIKSQAKKSKYKVSADATVTSNKPEETEEVDFIIEDENLDLIKENEEFADEVDSTNEEK